MIWAMRIPILMCVLVSSLGVFAAGKQGACGKALTPVADPAITALSFQLTKHVVEYLTVPLKTRSKSLHQNAHLTGYPDSQKITQTNLETILIGFARFMGLSTEAGSNSFPGDISLQSAKTTIKLSKRKENILLAPMRELNTVCYLDAITDLVLPFILYRDIIFLNEEVFNQVEGIISTDWEKQVRAIPRETFVAILVDFINSHSTFYDLSARDVLKRVEQIKIKNNLLL